MNINLQKKFAIKESFWDSRIDKWKYSIFKRITKKSLPFFFRGKDIISITPQTAGIYDSGTANLFKYLAANEYNEFLIDIGANIGLISCQTGSFFKEVHMFEPNPYACHVLKVNSFIGLKNGNYQIYEEGLGSKDEVVNLHIPYDNWGGAFIITPENEYDLSLLSEKDGYGDFNPENYELVPVKITSAEKRLTELFNDFLIKSYRKGVIKIDAEGMDGFIIEKILNALPAQLSIIILFENRNMQIDKKYFLKKHSAVSNIYKLGSSRSFIKSAPRWVNSLVHWWKNDGYIVIEEVSGNLGVGDFIISIDPQGINP